MYGESKLLVERVLSWLARIHGLRYASLRYFNAAGSDGHSGECHDPETHLIPLVLKAAAGAIDSISIFGTDFLEQPFSQHYNVYWAKTSERIFANDRARQEQFLININLSIINSYQFEARGCELTGAL